MQLKTTVFVLLLVIFSYSQENTIVFTAPMGETVINKHIYGHFAEHLGRCIYDGFYVGEDNTSIPNTNGVRNDIINALRELNIPNLRWPGGCFADTYHWKDGIGPKAERPTIVNTWWGNITEDNSFGTHDFLNLCEVLDTEPYISGNVGSGSVQELADWVQYVNFEGKSPMSDLRRQNGREEPWKVRFWGVGNEAWGCGGNMRPEYYVDIYRKYATFLSGAGIEDGLDKIASGASDADYRWTETLMRDIPHNLLQGVALHHYSVIDWGNKGSSTEFTEDQYFKTMQRSWKMEELIQKHTEIMDKYDSERKVDLVVDEWGGWYDVMPGINPGFLYQQNTMRDAMIAGMNLNIFNNHADRVKMANLAQTVNVLQAVVLTEGNKMILTPTYHVMEMYKVHQDAVLVPLQLKTDTYGYKGESLPAISASASTNKEGITHISLVNIDLHRPKNITISMHKGFNQVSGRILKSGKVQDHNSFTDPDKIKPIAFKGATLKKDKITIDVPPFSVVVLTLD